MRTPDCAECDRLWFESAALLLAYNAALDALAVTSRLDESYADRWAELASVSDRLYEVEKLECLHRDGHENV